MGRVLAALMLCCVSVVRADALVISSKPDRVTLSIYHQGDIDTRALAQDEDGERARNEGLAMVSEVRTLDLAAGPNAIQFRGVTGTMVPQTMQVSGLPGGVTQSNFDFDLLSPGSLIDRSIGQTVHLVRTGRKTGEASQQDAVIRSGPNGTVLQIGDRIEALGCSGLPENLVFDHLPDGLVDVPTLTVNTVVPSAGRYTITLRYIATGMNWAADYIARVNPDGRTLNLSGWITLANFSETSFAQAPVDVIAGQVATTGDDTAPETQALSRQPACWPTNINWATFQSALARRMAGEIAISAYTQPAPVMEVDQVVVTASRISARNLGDYKLYPLPKPTDVAARQTKQVQFLDNRNIPFTRAYAAGLGYDVLDFADKGPIHPAEILLRVKNTKQGGLGLPLPAGGVSAVAMDGNGPLLTGQDRMDDTPEGLPVEIRAGSTMSVRAEIRRLDSADISRDGRTHQRVTIEVAAINSKSQAVNFEWTQRLDGDLTLVSANRAHKVHNGAPLWTLSLKPGERSVFRYTMEN